MSKPLKLKRPTIELSPSRIRRDPVREEKKIEARSQERDIWLGVTGITIFAAAIATLTVSFSVITGKDGAAAASASAVQTFGPCEGGANCVVDGETIRIGGATVKIAGMTAPTVKSARCPDEEERGVDAAQQLTRILNSGKVTTAGQVTEPDGEPRTVVLVDGRDVGAAMIKAHMAREPRSEPPDWCSQQG